MKLIKPKAAKKTQMKLEAIFEKAEDSIWCRIEGASDFLPTTSGKSVEEVLNNLVMLIEDYVEHEGAHDKYWNKLKRENAAISLVFDVQAFFQTHEYLNVSAIAKRAGINPGLLRQYSSGVKRPSVEQAKKIQDTILELGRELSNVSLYA